MCVYLNHNCFVCYGTTALEVMDSVDSYVADTRNRLGVETPKLGIVYSYKENRKVHYSYKLGVQ